MTKTRKRYKYSILMESDNIISLKIEHNLICMIKIFFSVVEENDISINDIELRKDLTTGEHLNSLLI